MIVGLNAYGKTKWIDLLFEKIKDTVPVKKIDYEHPKDESGLFISSKEFTSLYDVLDAYSDLLQYEEMSKLNWKCLILLKTEGGYTLSRDLLRNIIRLDLDVTIST